MSDHRTLLRSASLVSVLTIVTRVFGYLRDFRIAALLGAGDAADAYTIAYRIPNLLRRLVGEGAVNAAFIPIFSRYLSKEDREEAWQFANTMITVVTLLMAAVTVCGILLAPLLVQAIAYGFTNTPGKLELTALLTRIMFPYIFLISLAALAMGILNSFNKFAAPAFAPVLLNLSVITLSYLTDYFRSPEIALAVGVVIGGVGQVAVQVPQLVRSGWRFDPRFHLHHPGVRRATRLMGPLVLGAGVLQVNIIVDGQFASFMGEGAPFALYISDRVMELVLGGYAVAIATVVLPMLSRNAALGQFKEIRSTLNFAARIILFITVPATVGLIVLRQPIVQVLFEHGEFDAEATALAAWPLLFFALGLSAFSMMKVMVPAFYSVQDTKTPVKVAFGAMILNVLLNFAFFRPLQVGGPALATSLSGLFNAVTLAVIFSRRQGALDVRMIFSSVSRFLIASVPLAVVAVALVNQPGFYYDQGLVQRIFALIATIASASAAYFGAAYLLKCPELWEVRDVFKKRAQKTDPIF